ncbi:Outer membrane transporter protein TsaT [Rhodoplanes serenus]|uniref:Outer membrane transporter protein TsaT n=1 Tax=Rhodoplanes serenus TaxID=200615 RepID=A0A3S4BYV6_9BRAD|nr:TRAP transporter substrate-binding protein [Rhodoplanes serenus]VCU10844.1 Outer membrane transporter protein TsaT [Rhodoplanes serenus]
MNRREFLAGSAALSVAGLAGGDAQAGTVLRASTWMPPQHVLNRSVLAVWAKEIEAASGGQLRVSTLPKAVAAPPGTFDAIADGVADIAMNVHGYTPGRFLLSTIAEFPGAGDSAEIASVAYQRVYAKHLARFDQDKKLKVLAVFTNGPGHIFNVRRPVRSVADLKDLRIRVGGGAANDIARLLDVSAVLKPASESYELLSSGIVDGVFFPSEPIATFKLDGIVKHGTLVPGGLYNTSWAMVMNRASYDRLSADLRDIVDARSGETLARLIGRAQDETDRSALAKIRASGIDLVTADTAFVSEIKARVRPLEASWSEQIKKLGADGSALLEAYRAELAVAAN